MHHDHLLSQLLGIPLSQFPDGGEIFPNSRTYDELNLRSSTIQQLVFRPITFVRSPIRSGYVYLELRLW
jgi:hypothetical protein